MDAQRLIDLEATLAPSIVKGRGVFSPQDRNGHAPWNLGGDKMGANRNGYAENYARVLTGFTPNVVVELGVFTGVSLAMWSHLFPEAEVIGLDLDFSRFHDAGVPFPDRMPTLVEFDAYGPLTPLTDLLDGRRIDFFVDDGPHTPDAVLRIAQEVAPLMASDGLYVLEDFDGAARILSSVFPDADVSGPGRWAACRLRLPGGN